MVSFSSGARSRFARKRASLRNHTQATLWLAHVLKFFWEKEKNLRHDGFEPSTPSLKVRCSTTELMSRDPWLPKVRY